MAHKRNDLNSHPRGVGPIDDGWDDNVRVIDRVDFAADLRDAVKHAATQRERLIVRNGDEELAAIIPMEDLDLLLRLEEEEEDRIDIEEARKALADRENQERIPWEVVKADLGL